MQEFYSRGTDYPSGKPFTTEVMQDTLKYLELLSEHNRFNALGNLMPTTPWPISIMGSLGSGSTWDNFKFKVNSSGQVNQLVPGGDTLQTLTRITFQPYFAKPSQIGDPSGGDAITTAFAPYVLGTGTERTALVITTRDDISDYGDMYSKYVRFTYTEDGTLAAGEVTCEADSVSAETLPNGNDVYYDWTISYGPGTTATDIYTFLDATPPTLFAEYFVCHVYNNNTGPVTMPGSTTKTIFMIRQGLSLELEEQATRRVLEGIEYIMQSNFTEGDPELCVFLRIPYTKDTTDDADYYSHLGYFPFKLSPSLSTANILFSWEMSADECDSGNLIPFVYQSFEKVLTFLDGTKFNKSKMSNGEFLPTSGLRTYELGGFSIFSSEGSLSDINTLGQVGELELINDDSAGFLKLIGRFWFYMTDDILTFYKYNGSTAVPAFSINRDTGAVLVGGGFTPPPAASSIKAPTHNTRTADAEVHADDTLLGIHTSSINTDSRSAILLSQEGRPEYSTMTQITQTGATEQGLYLTTHLPKIIIGTHNGVSADLTDIGLTKPQMRFSEDSIRIENAEGESLFLFGPTATTANTAVLSSNPLAKVSVSGTDGVEITEGTSDIILNSSGIQIDAGALRTVSVHAGGSSSYGELELKSFEATQLIRYSGATPGVGDTLTKFFGNQYVTANISQTIRVYADPITYTANDSFVETRTDDINGAGTTSQVRIFSGTSNFAGLCDGYLLAVYPSSVSIFNTTTINNGGQATAQDPQISELVAQFTSTGLSVADRVNAGTYSVGGTAGASGTFTTTDGKTVTVEEGLITSIV